MLHRAADMHPWPQYDIVAQHPVADVQDRAGMDQTFARVARVLLAHRAQILLGVLVGDPHWLHAEPSSDGQRRLIGWRTLRRRNWRRRGLAKGSRRCDRLRWERGASGDAELAVAFDLQFQPCCALGSGHGGGVAIIDRFLETALGGATL